MKYIVLKHTIGGVKRELPIIFPTSINHDDMATVTKCIFDEDNVETEVVSAGFVEVNARMYCTGKSETLSIESRGHDDSVLMRTLEYTHGIRDGHIEHLIIDALVEAPQ